MASRPWGRLPECTGKNTAMQRDFSATVQSSQKAEQPAKQMPAVFEGEEGQELEQSLGGTALPPQPLFITSVSPVLPLCQADTTCLSHTRDSDVGHLSWG